MTLIYLADLTHTTITISNDSFPLNIGLVAAYLKKFYPDVDIKLFKYPEMLKRAIDEEVPDILGFSNYPWNRNLDLSFLKYFKSKNNKGITVMGGPNISYKKKEQYGFLVENKNILDFYCMYEGETSFKSFFDASIKHNFDLEAMKRDDIKGILYLKGYPNFDYEKFLTHEYIQRMDKLEEVPSPYLTGILDKFFDGKLSPLIETHRGCPFTCLYCHEGHKSYAKVNQYSCEKVEKELEYIADHVGGKVSNLMFADPNFGMFESHIKIAEKIKEVFDRTGYPKTIFASTAKNRKEALVKISRILEGISMPIWMSVQSMTPEVLKNIKRMNINIDQMIQVQKELEEYNVNSKSELILSLPGESYQTHMDSLIKLMELKMGQIIAYQLMLVNGSEMVESDVVEKFEYQTKFRVIPRSITKLEGMDLATEIEEIVVSTKDLDFHDYVKARKLHLLTSIFYNGKIFSGFFKIIDEYGLALRDFVFKLNELFVTHPKSNQILENFVQETNDELFESEKEIVDYYSNDQNFEDYLAGEKGANLLHKYTSIFFMDHSNILTEIISNAALSLNDDLEYTDKVRDISRYYTNMFRYYLDSDRVEKVIEVDFKYNIKAWLGSNKKLDCFCSDKSISLVYYSPKEHFNLVENYFVRFGRSAQSFGKIMTRLWISEMVRKVKLKEELM